jgi:hypothetical protein
VGILNAIRSHGNEAVEQAAREALDMGAVSFDVVFNLLSRQTQGETPPPPEQLPEHLTLSQLPLADCDRYDRLLTASVSSPSAGASLHDGSYHAA